MSDKKIPVHSHSVADLPVGSGPGTVAPGDVTGEVELLNDGAPVGDFSAIDMIGGGVAPSGTPGRATYTPPGGGGSSTSIRSYGSTTAVYSGSTAPTTPTRVLAAASWGNRDLINSFDSVYNACYVDFLYDNGTRQTGLQFANLAAMVAWINSNVPQSGGSFDVSVTVEVYDHVDTSVPLVTKVWAQNSALGRLVGDRRYWNGGNQRTVSGPNWSGVDTALKAMFSNAHGFDPFPATPWTSTERRCFWVGVNRRKFYRCAWEYTQVVLPYNGAGGRSGVTAGGVISAATSTSPWTWNGSQNASVLTVTKGGSPSVISATASSFKDQAQDVVTGQSVLFGLPLTDGSGNYALMLKPMGVDLFFTNWLDPSQYRVEAVGGESITGHQGLRPLPAPAAGQYDAGSNTMGNWTLDAFIEAAGVGWPRVVHGHGARPGLIRFQVRDTATGNVSRLSSATVVLGRRNRWVQLPVTLQNRPD